MKIKEHIKKATIWLLSRIDIVNAFIYVFVKIPLSLIACYLVFIGFIVHEIKIVPVSFLTTKAFFEISLVNFVALLSLHFLVDIYCREDKKYWIKGNTFKYIKKDKVEDSNVSYIPSLPYGKYSIEEINEKQWIFTKIEDNDLKEE